MSLLTYPNKFLLTKCSTIKSPFDNSLSKIIEDMKSELKNGKTIFGNSGLGLTSNQLGYDKSIIIISNDLNKRKLNKINADKYTYRELINVKIMKKSREEIFFWEFCLSDQTFTYLISRPRLCTIKYQNLKGEVKVEDLDEIGSRILLHEYDHIEGKEYYSSYKERIELSSIFDSSASFEEFRKVQRRYLLF